MKEKQDPVNGWETANNSQVQTRVQSRLKGQGGAVVGLLQLGSLPSIAPPISLPATCQYPSLSPCPAATLLPAHAHSTPSPCQLPLFPTCPMPPWSHSTFPLHTHRPASPTSIPPLRSTHRPAPPAPVGPPHPPTHRDVEVCNRRTYHQYLRAARRGMQKVSRRNQLAWADPWHISAEAFAQATRPGQVAQDTRTHRRVLD